jgi:glutathione S-transferase
VHPNRLVTIPISHFCEKARWALDRAAVPYAEERHLQGIHIAHALRTGRSRTVPVLVCADGRTLTQSAAIVRWADERLPAAARLYPDGPQGAEAARLEAWLDAGLGPDGRLWMYGSTLPVMERLEASIVHGIPAWERRFFRTGRPVLNQVIVRYLGVSAPNATAALARVETVFDEVGARLADGRPYLCGERLTAADLAFAALSAAILIPPRYGSPLPALEDLPPEMVRASRRLRDLPAGRFALALYARERHLVAG